METVWKFRILGTSVQSLDLPKGARILCVQVQREVPHIWAVVDDSIQEYESWLIYIVGTGRPMPRDFNKLQYIGTCQLDDGYFVGHVFGSRESSEAL